MELTPEELAALKQMLSLLPKLQALLGAPAEQAAAPAPAVAPTMDTTPAPAPAAAPVAPDEKPKTDATPAPAAAEEKKTDAKDKPMTQEEQERIVNDSIELRDQARTVLGNEYLFKGKTSRQVMLDVINHVDSKLELGQRSDDAVRAAFDMAIPRFHEQQAAKNAEHLGLRGLHNDSNDDESFEASLHRASGDAHKPRKSA